MPIDYSTYPPDWFEIRERCLERAGHKCEQCGAANKVEGARDAIGKFRELTGLNYHEPWWDNKKLFRIVLTTAHTCTCNPKCGNEEHLKMLCQRCHLLLDLPHHITKRKATIRARKACGELFGENCLTGETNAQ